MEANSSINKTKCTNDNDKKISIDNHHMSTTVWENTTVNGIDW